MLAFVANVYASNKSPTAASQREKPQAIQAIGTDPAERRCDADIDQDINRAIYVGDDPFTVIVCPRT